MIRSTYTPYSNSGVEDTDYLIIYRQISRYSTFIENMQNIYWCGFYLDSDPNYNKAKISPIHVAREQNIKMNNLVINGENTF